LNRSLRKYLVSPFRKRLTNKSTGRILRDMRGSLDRFLYAHRNCKNVTICLTDNTRPFPDKEFLPEILRCLEETGFAKEDVTIFIATGLHRHLTMDELKKKLGERVVSDFRVIQNNPEDAVEVGFEGERFYVSPVLLKSDILIGTGIFEPHQYAGFSGGNKLFVIGCGGRRTIEYTHSADMILSKGVRIGNIVRNPFRGCIERYARKLPPRWVMNIVKDEKENIVMSDCGEPEIVFKRLSEWYVKNMSIQFPAQFDGVFVRIGSNKGVNLYQASRGATYISLSKSPIVKEGGPIVVWADLREGIGLGSGEEEFGRIIKTNIRNERLIDRLSNSGYGGGGQRALMFLRTLVRNPVVFTGYKKDVSFSRENLYFIRDSREALEYVRSNFGAREMLYISDPFVHLYSVKRDNKREI